MTATLTLCTCGKPTGEAAYLCGDCKATLWRALGDIPALVDELDITLTKQRRFTSQTGAVRASSEPALPYDIGASNVLHELRNELVGLVRVCMDSHIESRDYRDRLPDDTCEAMSRWLMWRIDGITAQPYAADTLRLVRIVDRAEHVILGPPPKTFAGPCDDCGRDLYAQKGKPVVTCHACGLHYDIETRRRWLLSVVDDRLATATEIARALTSLELPVTAERIRQWKHRDRIDVRAHDKLDRPLFRVGDVVDLLIEHADQRGA